MPSGGHWSESGGGGAGVVNIGLETSGAPDSQPTQCCVGSVGACVGACVGVGVSVGVSVGVVVSVGVSVGEVVGAAVGVHSSTGGQLGGGWVGQ